MTAIHRRSVKIAPDYVVGLGVGVGDTTSNLPQTRALGQKRKHNRIIVARLWLKNAPIN
jgi:hypothetical protein